MTEPDDTDILIILEVHIRGGAIFGSPMIIDYEQVDKDYRLPKGSTKRLITKAADLAGWQVQLAGATTAKLIRNDN
jgi:hypothetical protein